MLGKVIGMFAEGCTRRAKELNLKFKSIYLRYCREYTRKANAYLNDIVSLLEEIQFCDPPLTPSSALSYTLSNIFPFPLLVHEEGFLEHLILSVSL